VVVFFGGGIYFLFHVKKDTDVNKYDLMIESRCLSIFACLEIMPDELIEALHLPEEPEFSEMTALKS